MGDQLDDGILAGSGVILELRQYTLHPGRRDELIELFGREFVAPQEAVGMKIAGQFRDLDDPDRFVWLRSFGDMRSRRDGLAAFYGGAVWKANRDAANATMIDSDNVLLLRPAHGSPDFTAPAGKLVIASIHSFDSVEGPGRFAEIFDKELAKRVRSAGGSILGTFVTERSENDFPALPVREGENVFVWFASFADRAAYERFARDTADFPAAERLRLEPV